PPRCSQGSAAGPFSVVIGIAAPLTTLLCSRASTVPLNGPCTLSYFNSNARCFGSERSLIATTSKSRGRSARTRKTSRPIRPNPLMPTRNATTDLLVQYQVKGRRTEPPPARASCRSRLLPAISIPTKTALERITIGLHTLEVLDRRTPPGPPF